MLISFIIPLLLISLINSSIITTIKPYTTSLQIYHRLIQPSSFSSSSSSTTTSNSKSNKIKWSQKLLIRIDLNTNLARIDSIENENLNVDLGDLEGGEGLYQVGIREFKEKEKDDDDTVQQAKEEGEEEEEIKDNDLTSIIAIDSCFIRQRPTLPFQETFILNFLPPSLTSTSTNSSFGNYLNFFYETNTEVFCKHKKVYGSNEEVKIRGSNGIRGGSVKLRNEVQVQISRGKEPEIKYTPPKIKKVLGSDGKIVLPAKEKTFIQKYWIYGAVIFVIFMVTGPEEEAAKGGGGTGGASGVNSATK